MKTVIVVAVLLLLFAVPMARANPNPGPTPPSITVALSPNFLNNAIILKVDITVCYDTSDCKREAWYSLDGASNVSIPLDYKGMYNVGSYMPPQYSEVTGQIDMPMWSQNPHILTVYAAYTYGNFVSVGGKTLYLGQPEPTTPPPPIITVISPENQATYSSEVQVTYSIDSKIIWSYYALDPSGEPTSKDWKSFYGNITLSGLSQGTHKLVISVKPEGYYTYPLSEKAVTFNVDPSYISSVPISPSPTPITTPTVPEFSPLAILPLLLSVLSATALLVMKKRYRVNG